MNHKKNYVDYIAYVKTLNRSKKDDYYEVHHIIPKCLGGSNSKENLVLLTGREHFLAHYLLTKIYPENEKLLFAFIGMKRISDSQKRYVNSLLYEKAKIKANEIKSKKVICVETGKIYPSATYVEENIISGIRDVIYGRQLTAGGYHWKYENESPNYKKPFETKKVICANNNMIFNSSKEAAEFAGVSHSRLKAVLNNNGKNANGLTFYYYEGEKDYPLKKRQDTRKKVICVETGEIFNSIKEASNGSKSASVNICNCCKNKKKSYKGKHYQYVDN